MIGGFTWGEGGTAITPDEAKRRRELAQLMIQQGTANKPIQHWTQGAANVAQALMGAYDMRQVDKLDAAEAAKAKAAEADFIANPLGGGMAAPATAPASPAVAPAGGVATPPGNIPPAALSGGTVRTDGMQPTMVAALGDFQKEFPEVKITSGYRDPSHNARVGGASGSRHIQGDATDFSLAGLPEDRQKAAVEWWNKRGAGGFGFYPQKNAMHVDFGQRRFWGPNFSSSSLGQTPQWFQAFAAGKPLTAAQQAQAEAAGVDTTKPPPEQPQMTPTPPAMAERSLGAMMRNAREMGGQGQPPTQVASTEGVPLPPQRPAMLGQPPAQPLANVAPMQPAPPPAQVGGAPVPSPQAATPAAPAQAPTPTQLVAQANPQALSRAMAIASNPRSSPGAKAVAQAMIQRLVSQETKDPRDGMLKDVQIESGRLAIEEKRRGLGKVEMETITAPDGTVFEREKGKAGAQFQPSLKLPAKPEDRTTDQKELAQANEERKAAGLPSIRMDEYRLQKAKAGAANIDLGGGSGKQVFDTMEKRAEVARSAVTGLTSLREARKAVEAGGIFGAGADQRLGFAKLAGLFGFDSSKVTNTETFRSAIAPQVASVMKAVVGNQNISNSDREFAEKAAGGSINLDETSIKRLLDIMEKASMEAIRAHQEEVDAVYPADAEGKFRRERALVGIRAPVAAPPADPTAANSNAAALRSKYGLE